MACAASLGGLAEKLSENVDLSVRFQSEVGDPFEDLPLLDPSVKDQLEAIDEVERISGAVFEFNTVAIDADGNALDPGLGRQGGDGWPEDESLGPIFVLDDGVSRRPAGPDEFTMDHHTATDHGFQIGERYQVSTPSGTRSFELVGYHYFLEPDYRLALQQVAWDMATARQLLHGGGGYDRIDVGLSPGASLQAVIASIERTLGPSIEVLSQQDQTDERKAEFDEITNLFRNQLLAFAVIVLVISAFITYNTFHLVMGQRIKELGLLRVLGASRLQLAQTVALEALAVGVVATVAGLGLGVLVARAIMSALQIAGAHPAADRCDRRRGDHPRRHGSRHRRDPGSRDLAGPAGPPGDAHGGAGQRRRRGPLRPAPVDHHGIGVRRGGAGASGRGPAVRSPHIPARRTARRGRAAGVGGREHRQPGHGPADVALPGVASRLEIHRERPPGPAERGPQPSPHRDHRISADNRAGDGVGGSPCWAHRSSRPCTTSSKTRCRPTG